MTTRYNKSEIMKLMHHYMRVDGFNKSVALKMAWSKARNNEFYMIIEKKPLRTPVYNSNKYSASLTNYYANNAYNGD